MKSLLLTLIAVIIFSKLLTGRKIPKDAMLGFSFVFAIAIRILIMQKTPKVEVSEIENLLRGDILFVTPEAFYGMLAVFIIVMLVHFLFFAFLFDFPSSPTVIAVAAVVLLCAWGMNVVRR